MPETQYDTQIFAEFYDVQPQAIVWLSPIRDENSGHITDFGYTYANDEGLKYLNLTREKLAGLTIASSPTLTDQLRKDVFEEMLEVYTTDKKSETTIYNPALDKYARVLRTKLRDGILSVMQDITRENLIIRQLEEHAMQLEEQTLQLQEQKTLMDNIVKNSSNGISVSKVFRDDSGKVVDALTIMANDAAVRYIGFPREIYLTKRATEIEPAVMGSPYYQACIKTLETGEPFVMQYRVEATGKWLELTVSRLDYNHLIQVFTDVTPIREVQHELEKTATVLKTVFNSAQTGMFTFAPVYDGAGTVTDFCFAMVNTTVAAYFGQSPEALEGEPGSKWFPAYFDDGVFEMYRHSFETGEPQRKEVHYYFGGEDKYLDLQSIRIDHHLLVSMTDYTSLRKSQIKLEQTINALERSNTHLEDFAYAASHDMKEPLRKILTFTERLKSVLSTRLSDTENRLFERIEISAQRMQLLVDDLLEFSHVSEQTQLLEKVDLNEKVQRVLSDLELLIEEKRARINIGSLPTIMANRRQMQQLFQNLIGNALKYSKPDVPPVISINSRRVKGNDVPLSLPSGYGDKAFHLIGVSDNGIGFEQQYAEQIFKMFQRLHGKAEYSGTGVGLSIARKVVENHQGYIWAEGEVDKGATFRILLPAE
jgi:signal transduction histidine kinase